MFMAALWSRLCVVPQALHVQTRSASVRSSFMKPQTLQVLLDGYHLSILAKVFPCDVSLCHDAELRQPSPLEPEHCHDGRSKKERDGHHSLNADQYKDIKAELHHVLCLHIFDALKM